MAQIPLSEFLVKYGGRKAGRDLTDKESKDISELSSRAEVKDYLASAKSKPVAKKAKGSAKAKSEVVKDDGKKQ
tara:strand:+ start:2326 stop:2547 length:222 start_codon:yes stop_codon:yes gene_type:complete